MPDATAYELSDADRRAVDRLRAGDEEVFAALVREHTPSLRRVARGFVPSDAVADEVVQETWLGLLDALPRFEGRASLKTFLFRILVNRARTRGERERRTIPFAALAARDAEADEPHADADRFADAGFWGAPPVRWTDDPERALTSRETVDVVKRAIATLPETQRTVITLRDLEGWSSEEVRNALELSETNQRVLLHRARTKVRRVLEEHLS